MYIPVVGFCLDQLSLPKFQGDKRYSIPSASNPLERMANAKKCFSKASDENTWIMSLYFLRHCHVYRSEPVYLILLHCF